MTKILDFFRKDADIKLNGPLPAIRQGSLRILSVVAGEISERAGGATIQMVGRLGGNSQVCLAGVKTLNFGAGGLIFHLRGECW